MSGTRGGVGRIVAVGIGLALALLLLAATEARAGRYSVAQCGWYIGADADWADSTGGAKLYNSAGCVPPAGGDPFEGMHLKSLTRPGQGTLTGTRFARWRWVAPPGTGITQVRGTWWHSLHDGFEHRIGVGTAAGGFSPFAVAAGTDLTPREFVAGFPTPMPALEDRLLCARPENSWCALDPASWSGLRALTITLEDGTLPGAWIAGPLLAGGWRRGAEGAAVWSGDSGSGLRSQETIVDGTRVGLTEFPCNVLFVGSEWKGTVMQPCPLNGAATHTISTTAFSDGLHHARTCAVDFSGNAACSVFLPFLIDNNPPAHPGSLSLAGGDGWRRVDDFDVSWANPDQGPASPIAGASWRLLGGAGFDTGAKFAAGRNRTSLNDLSVPAAGTYSLQLWLRDEAGNENPASAVTVPLRFDDVAPGLAFVPGLGDGVPERVEAEVTDAHSGPASGTIHYRRADSQNWVELPTKLLPTAAAGTARLSAPMPDLSPGTYLFRADAADAAGNTASSTRRADGTEMAVRKVAPVVVPRAKTRLFARLRGGHGRGDALTVPFAAPAILSGRLTRADGAGIAGRELRVIARPSRGALVPNEVAAAVTGERGGFELPLAPGPSRQVAVVFPGDGALEPSSRPSLDLRVRAGVSLRAAPPSLRTGQVVRLSGRVRTRGAPVPRRGKLVAIQYLEAATHRWRPVLVTRSDHGGRFRARYRFRYVSGSASIRMRATALPEERWPYAPGSSRPVTVRVSGR
jgi:hypothetical protein